MDFCRETKRIEKEICGFYRHFHEHPELSGQERETQKWILTLLQKWEVEAHPCAETGVYAVLRGREPGHTIALRADMDALSVTERTGLSWESKQEGVMHACGHDAHMAMLLGSIRLLQEYREKLRGTLLFVFQPSEEKDGGAKRILEEGILQNLGTELAVAFHVWPQRAHTITCMPGPVMAQPDAFSIEVRGKGGHGATPHLCKNPVEVLAALVPAIQALGSRALPPQAMAVVNVCKLHCGENYNVVAERGRLEGTIRTYDETVREQLLASLQKLAQSIPEAYGMQGDFQMSSGYPATINDEKAAKWAYEILKAGMKETEIFATGEPSMLGEDFSYFRSICPSLYLRLGCWPKEEEKQYPLHHNGFRIEEAILAEGTAAFCMLASAFLEQLHAPHRA